MNHKKDTQKNSKRLSIASRIILGILIISLVVIGKDYTAVLGDNAQDQSKVIQYSCEFSELADTVSAIQAAEDYSTENTYLIKITYGNGCYSDVLVRSGNFVIDLNGKDNCWLNGRSIYLYNGNLTITDSSIAKTGRLKRNAGYAIQVQGGTLTIDGGNYGQLNYSNKIGAIYQTAGSVVINDGNFETNNVSICTYKGNLTINGGTFTTYDKYPVVVSSYYGPTSAIINGGTFNSTTFGAIFDNTDATITGGTISATNQPLYITNNTTISISDGTFTSTGDCAIRVAKSTLNISGGTYNAEYSAMINIDSDVTISAGTFSSSSYVCIVSDKASDNDDACIASTTIDGGSFSGFNSILCYDGTFTLNGGNYTADYTVVAAKNGTITLNGGNYSGNYSVGYNSSTVALKVNGGCYHEMAGFLFEDYDGVVTASELLGDGLSFFVTVGDQSVLMSEEHNDTYVYEYEGVIYEDLLGINSVSGLPAGYYTVGATPASGSDDDNSDDANTPGDDDNDNSDDTNAPGNGDNGNSDDANVPGDNSDNGNNGNNNSGHPGHEINDPEVPADFNSDLDIEDPELPSVSSPAPTSVTNTNGAMHLTFINDSSSAAGAGDDTIDEEDAVVASTVVSTTNHKNQLTLKIFLLILVIMLACTAITVLLNQIDIKKDPKTK